MPVWSGLVPAPLLAEVLPTTYLPGEAAPIHTIRRDGTTSDVSYVACSSVEHYSLAELER